MKKPLVRSFENMIDAIAKKIEERPSVLQVLRTEIDLFIHRSPFSDVLQGYYAPRNSSAQTLFSTVIRCSSPECPKIPFEPISPPVIEKFWLFGRLSENSIMDFFCMIAERLPLYFA